jgi:TfoX/Sxy family transcriptional regulator of competence genes
MQIPKPSESDKEQFRSLHESLPGVEIKPMFGNLGAFVNGNMFSGLFGSTIGLRLSDSDREDLAKTTQLVPFGPSERPMSGYVGMQIQGPPEQIALWVEKALHHVSNMPPKAAKAPKNAKASKAGKPSRAADQA